MEKELEKLEEVWGLVGQWEDSWDKYKSLTFWELETDEMEENVMFLFRYTFKFLDSKVVMSLGFNSASNFVESLPKRNPAENAMQLLDILTVSSILPNFGSCHLISK